MAKLRKPKKEVSTLDSKNLFIAKTFNQTIKEAMDMKIPNMLFSEFIFESDLTILFASAGVGKTMLAIQIAESIAKGTSIEGFVNESKPQRVLYLDFELSMKQLEGRYCEVSLVDDKKVWFNQYQWHDNLIRITFNSEVDARVDVDSVFESILAHAHNNNAKVIFIDNITWIAKQGLETSKDAGLLMKKLDKLKKEHNFTLVVLAHTPKKYTWSPMELIDLAGSMQLANFCDSVFAINFSKLGKSYRYLKQVKCRFTENKYHSKNVITAQITKVDPNFTGYQIEEPDEENILEANHLESKNITAIYSEEQIKTNKEKAQEKIKENPTISCRVLADEIDVSHETANKYLKLFRHENF